MTRRLLPLLTVLALGRTAHTAPGDPAQVEYPAGFRQWAHVKSMVIFSDKHPLFAQFGGFHSVYVNPKGLPPMTKGGSFPDGSVLVFDLLEAREQNGAYTEGDRKLIGVMAKDRQRFKLTGGWGFEAFKGDSRTERTVTDAAGQCFSCHQPQKANDFVFSGFHP